MNYSGYELAMLFLTYSFLGWVIETVVNTIKKKKFINRGFFSGPFCFIYGVAAVAMTVILWELKNQVIFLFIGCMILATAIEWVTGKLLERMNHHKWWDYSHKKFNFDGYICLQYSVIWGILGVIVVKFTNGFFAGIYEFLPALIAQLLVWVFAVIAAIDGIASLSVVLHIKKEMQTIRRWNSKIGTWTYKLGHFIVDHVEKRMVKAYPVISQKAQAVEKEGKFAEGCGFFKVFWLLIIGAVLGDLVETVFCRLTAGVWMSRSSLVWGPFSMVWGLALAIATMLLYKDRHKPDGHIFLVGTFLGGAYEYICSVFTEIVFGKVFWDYSDIPFNLGGRVNLLYCFFWGIAAVVWIKLLYPRISGLIEKVPKIPGTIVTWLVVAFMMVNVVISMLALTRYDTRAKGEPANSSWEQMIDEHFDDARMERIYPNAIER